MSRLPSRARRERIMELLAAHTDGTVEVERLSETLDVSLATVRRDLAQLREEGRITRTYGGAVLGGGTTEISVRQRRMKHVRQKDAIARQAAEYVEDDQVVLLDAGTTTERLARYLLGKSGLTVFTNGLGAVNTLVEEEGVDVVVMGGRLRRINQTMTGPGAEEMVRGLYADIAFLGADAVHPTRGIASRTFEQSSLKTLMSQHTRRLVVVADSAKLLDDASSYWSPIDRPWTLLTDDGADPEALAALRAASGGDLRIVVCPTTDLPPTDMQ
ncbi:DeoR/GlpR family DNA-binding transcription regulator [Nonomuraea sp. NPDC050022]|uniref:DeoR/GlpR family DNA-binding transcription regulator n=1 Tax=Nonomuraea sp. NPDC050022 TaxID=3364358 RepID=UPI003798FF08